MSLPAGTASPELLLELAEPFQGVQQELELATASFSPEVEAVLRHLVHAGGKRLRPLLALLAAKCFCPDPAPAVPVAVAAELIHMATLAHDDVLDGAALRRGRRTLNAVWGNQTAILAGDVLLARALVMLADTGRLDIVRIMASMVDQMCAGEIVQDATVFHWEQTEEEYFARIERKTACFFAACCQAGALAGGAAAGPAIAMSEYGRAIGLAFQVVDDLLDLCADSDTIGKPAGSDLMEGIITLPVIFALRHPLGQSLRGILEKERITPETVARVAAVARECGGLEYARSKALALTRQAREALAAVGPSDVLACLESTADLIVQRTF